jgi:hypothetical protein
MLAGSPAPLHEVFLINPTLIVFLFRNGTPSRPSAYRNFLNTFLLMKVVFSTNNCHIGVVGNPPDPS